MLKWTCECGETHKIILKVSKKVGTLAFFKCLSCNLIMSIKINDKEIKVNHIIPSEVLNYIG